MTAKLIKFFDRFARNKDGKIVIWQKPNIPLWGWIVFSVLGMICKHGAAHDGFRHVASASLFTWAYLEIRSGESIFRRVLGVIVMAGVTCGFFRG